MNEPFRVRLAGWLLERALGREAAISILGDLEEQLAARGTRWHDRIWYGRQVLGCLFPHRAHAISGRNRLTRRPGGPMDTLGTDLRFALRTIRKGPAFAGLVALTLAAGIAATTVVYSAVDGLVLRPFPFPEPARLVGLGTAYPKLGTPLGFMENLSPAEYLDGRAATSLVRPVAWDMGNRQVTVGETTENLFSGFWWGDPFPTLGIAPFLGRGFLAEEIRSARSVAVLSHRVWQNRFGADSSLVGRRILVYRHPFLLIAIIPPPTLLYAMDLWIPLPVGPEVFPRNRRQFQVMARLAPGVSLAQANTELELIARRVEGEHGAAFPEYAGWRIEARTWNDINVQALEPAAFVLLGAVVFVMLLVSTNVATLLLGRSSARAREIALRSALGAGRGRILRQLLTESVLLALIGAALGIALGYVGVGALGRVLESLPIPVSGTLAVSGRVLAVTAAVAVAAGLGFGIVPALHALRMDPHRTLQADSGGATSHHSRLRLQRTLVAVEAALAITLLAAGGYLVRSFLELRAVEPGFAPDRLLTMRLSLARERYPKAAIEPFFATLREQVGAIPGVRAVATASQFPPGVFLRQPFQIEGTAPPADQLPIAFATLASPGFFEAMGIPLERGRTFGPDDRAESPWVAVVNQPFVTRYFAGEDPIGRRIQVGGPNGRFVEIVGISGATRNRGLDQPPEPEMFLSTVQADGVNNQLYLIVRAAAEPRALVGAVRQVVKGIDAEQPVYAIRTVEDAFARTQFSRRISTVLLGLFAAFALVLAAVGIYGVVSYASSQRTREVGVRMALGASRGSVARLFVRQALAPVAIGSVAGLAAAVGIGTAMRSLLFSVDAGDPATLVAAASLLTAVGLAAAFLPAWRASRLDPVRALRSE